MTATLCRDPLVLVLVPAEEVISEKDTAATSCFWSFIFII